MKYSIEERSVITGKWVPTQDFYYREDAFRVWEARKYVSRYRKELRKDIRLMYDNMIVSNPNLESIA